MEQDTLKTFDDVEIQHTLPDRCMHVLAKDCTKNNSFIVLMSKDTRHPDKKIIEILVEQEKIRIAHLGSAGYQIQVRIYIFFNFFWFPYFCLIFSRHPFFDSSAPLPSILIHVDCHQFSRFSSTIGTPQSTYHAD